MVDSRQRPPCEGHFDEIVWQEVHEGSPVGEIRIEPRSVLMLRLPPVELTSSRSYSRRQ
jgi:hypothetical protein